MTHKTRGTRTNYPSDVSDEQWAFCAPYLTLMKEDSPQRDYSLRAIFNVLRYMVRAGCPWRMMPNDLPPGLPSSNMTGLTISSQEES
jgi:transposase